jgi:hypothetical protein
VPPDRYHVQLLSTPRHVHDALRYVLLNARRHAAKKKAMSAVGIWRFDPAKQRPEASAPERDATRLRRPPVARAKTWLLAVGWRRHGLLDPADGPG